MPRRTVAIRPAAEHLGALDTWGPVWREAGVGALHLDVGDGVFVPWFGAGDDAITALRPLGFDVEAHLLALRPERHVQRLVDAGATTVIVHVEATHRADAVLNQIRNAGARPGIAILPATPLTKLGYLLPLAERVQIVCGNVADRRKEFFESTLERIRLLQENIAYYRYKATLAVDPITDPDAIERCLLVGARRFVIDPPNVGPTEFLEAFAEFTRDLNPGRRT